MNNYLAHCVDMEDLYGKMLAPVCERYGLTYMELTILLFLANNPRYDTATEIVKFRHLTKSHVSLTVRSLQIRELLVGRYQGGDRKTIHLRPTEAAAEMIAAGQAAQAQFYEVAFAGFSDEDKAYIRRMIERVGQNLKAFRQQKERQGEQHEQ